MYSIVSPLRLKFNSDALIANWHALHSRSATASTGAAVKANGYGIGALEVVKRLAKAGCNDFFVAHWSEAAQIADIVPAHQISVLNGVGPKDIDMSLQIGATPVLNSPCQVQLWKSVNGGNCHVMIDSGINRLGIGPEQITAIDFADLDIDILMTHLASADEDVPQNAQQLAIFNDAAMGISSKRKSLCNSAGIMLGSDYHFDVTRPGLALYGGIPRADMAEWLRPVVQPQAEILQVRTLPIGAAVGYNATYIAQRQVTVATAAIGYADGYPRGMTNIGKFQFQDFDLPVIGRVSMDMVTLDISAAQDIRPGDWVDVDFNLSLAAQQSGLSQYELLTGLGQRADQIWI
jgi:alanine racemase